MKGLGKLDPEQKKSQGALINAAKVQIEAALTELRERRPDRAIETNVEFWAAVILDFAGVPPAMMPAMFTCGRTAGWCAHILEQKRLGKLVRPAAISVCTRLTTSAVSVILTCRTSMP